MVPAIILSAHTMALGVIRALGSMGVPIVVVYYKKSDFAQTSKYVCHKQSAPHPEESPEEFLQLLINMSKKFSDAILVPVSDETLLFTAEHKHILEEYFRVACPDYETIRTVIDKQWTYPVAKQAGVSVPTTQVFNSPQELQRHCDQFVFPCLVKPTLSHLYVDAFGVKMNIVEDQEQLKYNFARAHELGLEVMVQEYIPGQDSDVYNYNAYVHKGVPLAECTAGHIRNAPPLFGSPRVAISEKCPELLDVGRKLVKALNYSGYACIEFKRDCRDGEFKLMEVNGRHNLSTSLSVACGVNFPWIEYQHRLYGTRPDVVDFTDGIYWVDLTRDLAYSAKHIRDERLSIKSYLLPYRGNKVFAIYDRSDLRPFWARIRTLLVSGKGLANQRPPQEGMVFCENQEVNDQQLLARK